VQTSVNDTMTVDGIVREEFAKDEPFIGPVGEQPRPSFRVARDVYEGYMLLVRPGDEEIHVKPMWVALALLDPMLSSSSERFQYIRVQYFMATSKTRAMLETYASWDTKRNMKWKATSNEPPCWIHTSCILTAWKIRSNAGSICIPPQQVKIAKDNLARCEEFDLGGGDSCSE
jgi:hypothetical protein